MTTAEASTCSFFSPLFSSVLNEQKKMMIYRKDQPIPSDLSFLILIHTFLCHFEDQMRKWVCVKWLTSFLIQSFRFSSPNVSVEFPKRKERAHHWKQVVKCSCHHKVVYCPHQALEGGVPWPEAWGTISPVPLILHNERVPWPLNIGFRIRGKGNLLLKN